MQRYTRKDLLSVYNEKALSKEKLPLSLLKNTQVFAEKPHGPVLLEECSDEVVDALENGTFVVRRQQQRVFKKKQPVKRWDNTQPRSLDDEDFFPSLEKLSLQTKTKIPAAEEDKETVAHAAPQRTEQKHGEEADKKHGERVEKKHGEEADKKHGEGAEKKFEGFVSPSKMRRKRK
ncbi:MAG: uncharacterized protein A8A55_2842 [Amphiamblys sp. WSBS2006]|nr:MAG: uncharacterized protein A8A55_2842 [Amphiamblys sp. WSBS2006]